MSGDVRKRWTRSLRCEDAFRQLDDYLDGALSPEEMRLVEEHLAECDQCTDEYGFERSLIEHIREKLRGLDMPEGLRTRISERLREEDPGSLGGATA